jgi:DNA-binding NarL/FixJ family response regulator
MHIAIVDDHPMFAAGLQSLCHGLFPDCTCHTMANYAALQAFCAAHPAARAPDIILLDLMFPGFNLPDHFPLLRAHWPLTPIIVISMVDDAGIIQNVITHGANGFLAKSLPPADLATAIGHIMDGHIVIKMGEAPPIPTHDTVPGHPTSKNTLTPRQQDILHHLHRGYTNKQIAQALALSPFTVRSHVSALMKIYNVSTRAALAAIAEREAARHPAPADQVPLETAQPESTPPKSPPDASITITGA